MAEPNWFDEVIVAAAQGRIPVKPAVRLVSTSNLVSLSGLIVVDGVGLQEGDPILVAGQSNMAQNGWYTATSGAWKRRSTEDSSNKIFPGSLTYVYAGANAGWWALTTAPPFTLGTTPLLFEALQLTGGVVPPTRNIIAGAGLTGGGNLTMDRTLDVVAADSSIQVNADDIQVGVLASDAQHGVRGGGTQHATATTLVAGFLSAADKVKLDGTFAASDASVSATADKLLLRGPQAEGLVSWIEVGHPNPMPASGILRAADAFELVVKANSGDIGVINHLTGSDNFTVADGAVQWENLAVIPSFANVIYLPNLDPTSLDGFGRNTEGRLRMFIDGSARSAAIVPNISATKVANYNAAWDETVRIDPSGGTFTVTAPTAVGNAGRCFAVANVTDSAVSVTIDGNGAETINGFANVALGLPRGFALFQSDGTNLIQILPQQGLAIVFGHETIGTTATTRYLVPGGRGGTASTSVKVARLPKSRVVSSITYTAGTAGVGTGSYTFTLFRRTGGVPVNTTLTVTVLTTDTTGRADFTPIVLAKDDEVGVVVTNTGSLTTSPNDVTVVVD